MTYAEAKRALRKIGCSSASGAALAAMYAPLIVRACALSPKSEPKLYAHLRTCADIGAEARRLIQDPFAALDVAL